MKQFLTCILAITLVAPWLRAQALEDETMADREVALPTYSIEEKMEKKPRKPVVWYYASIEGFEVLSSGGETQTKRLVRELQRYRIALQAAWPQAVPRWAPPTSLIICGHKNSFDAFAPFDRNGEFIPAVSRFLPGTDRGAIVLDVTNAILWVPDPDLVDEANTAIYDVDHYLELTRAYIRYLIGSIRPEPQPWLAEGLAQLLSAVKYDRMTIEFGSLPASATIYTSSTDATPAGFRSAGESQNNINAEAQAALRIGNPMMTDATGVSSETSFNRRGPGAIITPVEQLLAMQPGDPATNFTIESQWARTSYAFVHLCIYGEKGRFQKGFFTFIDRLQREPLSEKLFKECFGMDYKKFSSFLRRYTGSSWYHSVRFDLKRGKLPDPEPFELREATPAEVARIRGDALLLARGADTAFLALVEPYQDGEADAQLLASLGLVESARDQSANARAFLEEAVKQGVERPRAYTELARLRLAALQSDSAARLSKTQLASVLRPLFSARSVRPAMPETYLLIAQAWEISATPPTKENLAVLLEGAALFPSNSALLMRAARLHQDNNFLREAGALANLGAAWASDPDRAAQFRALEASLPAEARVDLAKSAEPRPGGTGKPARKKP